MDEIDSLAAEAGVSREAMEEVLAEEEFSHEQDSPAPSDATTTPARVAMPNLNRAWGRAMPRAGLRMLPDVMTALGGVAGFPAGPLGMVVMGGLGRAGGEAMKQLGEHAMGEGPQSAGEAYGRINRAAGVGGAMEAGGMLARPLMSYLAPRFARAGLRTPVGMEKEAQTFGKPFDVERTAKIMLRDKAPTSKRAAQLRVESSRQSEKAIEAFDRRLKKFNAKDLAQELIRSKQRTLGRRLTDDERKATIKMVRDRANELLDELTPGTSRVAQTPGGNPARALFSGREIKNVARAAREASRSTMTPDASKRVVPGQKSLDQAIYRGALRTKARIPGVAEADRLTRDRINLERALIQREGSHAPTTPQLAATSLPVLGGFATGNLPHALPAAAATYALSSPGFLRRLAIGVNDPRAQLAASQWPALPSALWQALTDDSP